MITVLMALLSTIYFSPDPVDEGWQAAEEWIAANPVSYLRVELKTPGGSLPFVIRSITGMSKFNETVWFHLEIVNGRERTKRGMNAHEGGDHGPATARIDFPEYGSVLEAEGTGDCSRPSLAPRHFFRSGTWTKMRGDSVAEIPFKAEPVESTDDRFDAEPDAGDPSNFSGRWSVDFSSSDDLAIGVFDVDENQLATGTFLTTTGDYRYLAGRVDGDLMRLSTFDGAHAFLFHARMQPDGTIQGDFWSGNWWHETWTAERDPDAKLPDMFEQTTVADADSLDDLTFKALDGTPTKVADLLDATGAPARVLYVFGTWCPNCADAAAELKRLKDLHADNLGVVGLAFELTDDHERSATQVRRYLERHGGTWPILIAGLSDKSKASAELPILDKVRSYPTTIFLNSKNEIVSVHTGFTGPAAGEAFSDQQREYERIIAELISEQP